MECVYTHRQKVIECDIKNRFNFFFFGDVHRDTSSCDVERWKKFLKDAKQTTNAYYFLMGDANDFASTKEKKIISDSTLHDTTREKLDYIAEKDIRRICSEMSFMRGRMLGVIEGNHSWVFMNGDKSDQMIADRMEADYLGWLCAYSLTFRFSNRSNSSYTLQLALCHGRAGGKRIGASINQVEDLRNMVFPAMDIYVMAHNHTRGAWPESALVPKYGMNNWRMKQLRQWYCRSGSFKKGYTPGVGGYEVGRLLRPSDLGALQIQVGFERTQANGDDVIYADVKAII